ncbi:MAG TPA: CPBP family glutamic-type intramembrane protease, partial [Anaerolineales bacterium]|nr:CPBP family glutamic-type intramembrane protease [Anaerolineales bacterium]
QKPRPALLDALRPGMVEEVIYRFAHWGLLRRILQRSLPQQAVWLAGGLAMLTHTYSHFDDLFIQSPLTALGMGAALALLWGLPPLILARRRGLESAIAFHWIQDAARFMTGF